MEYTTTHYKIIFCDQALQNSPIDLLRWIILILSAHSNFNWQLFSIRNYSRSLNNYILITEHSELSWPGLFTVARNKIEV